MQNISESIKEQRRSLITGALIGISLALVFAAGFFFRDLVGLTPVMALASSEPTNGYPLLDEVQTLLDRHYLREQPDAMTRQYAAIRGVLGALEDRYTFFIDPPVAQSESDVLAGTYGGIGVFVQRNESGDLVLFPFDDGPARSAGIEDGDVLVAVNGAPVDLSLPQDSIDQMLRGEVKEGSGVEITVRRAGSGEEMVVFVLFDVINVPSIDWRVLSEDERIGYIQILRFTSRTPEELTTAVDDLKAQNIAALVVDLRGNSGGLLQESIAVADAFIDDDVIAYEVDQDSERVFDGAAGGLVLDLPLAVLVNQRTASGAELVAGALQDYARGILVGQQTFGKGTIQQIFPLSDGSSLHVTSAEWFTPNRQPLDANGLMPDIPMIPDENGRDVELGEAIRQLQAALTEAVAAD
jgi:carboxyl-terminal processing protease